MIVMGHGLGAVREMRLDAYAERFAAAGFIALPFTYRHFGDSGGEPRQLLDVPRQLEDWRAAIRYARRLPGAGPVAVWGTSFGGGHAIEIAADAHNEIAAAVVQCPFTDGPASALTLKPQSTLRLAPLLAADLLAQLRDQPPVLVSLAGDPGEAALMATSDAVAGLRSIQPRGGDIPNAVAARAVLQIVPRRPGRAARNVRCPILFCVSDTDTVAPPGPTLRHARRAPRGEIRRYEAGHFEFYNGEPFEQICGDQVEFFTRHLLPAH